MVGTGHRTTVHLLRHGEVHNPDGVLYGRLPGYHLSERGQQMASLIADYLTDVDLNVIRTSPLERARETAQPIMVLHPDVELGVDERLIEADSKFAGQVFGPRNKALLDPRNWRYLRDPFTPSWGEPNAQIAARMTAAVVDAAAAAGPGGQALLVSHQSPIWIGRLALEGRRLTHLPASRICRLGSITSVHFIDGHVVGIDYVEPAASLYDTDANAAFSSGN